jgi:hypothetical protein
MVRRRNVLTTLPVFTAPNTGEVLIRFLDGSGGIMNVNDPLIPAAPGAIGLTRSMKILRVASVVEFGVPHGPTFSYADIVRDADGEARAMQEEDYAELESLLV